MLKRHAHAHDWLYPMQFACFECRKSFKQHMWVSQFDKHQPLCPQCGAKMWLMGRAFKAPAKSSVKQWRKVEFLIRNGFLFHPNQFGWARSPKTLREAEAVIKRLRKRSKGEMLLERIPRRKRLKA